MIFSRELLNKLSRLDLRIFMINEYHIEEAKRYVNKENFTMRCPHPDHEDKKPSFSVWRKNGQWGWCCFGCHCGKKDLGSGSKKNYGSDIIAFVMWMSDYEGSPKIYSFYEAVLKICRWAGIEVQDNSSNNKSNLEYKIQKKKERNKHIAELLHENFIELGDIKAKRYIYNRGLNDQDLKDWLIGYNGERITFPLFDKYNNILAFSDRIVGEHIYKSKYINSPNDEIFDKSRYLYGVNKVDPNLNYLILTEGQMDVIGANKYGLKNVIAVLGSYVSQEHLDYIKEEFPKVDSIILAFDNDSAGLNGARKSYDLIQSSGFSVYYVDLPKCTDLYDFVSKYKEQSATKFFSLYLPGFYKELEEEIKEYDNFIINIRSRINNKAIDIYNKLPSQKDKDLFDIFLKDKFGLIYSRTKEKDKIYESS